MDVAERKKNCLRQSLRVKPPLLMLLAALHSIPVTQLLIDIIYRKKHMCLDTFEKNVSWLVFNSL